MTSARGALAASAEALAPISTPTLPLTLNSDSETGSYSDPDSDSMVAIFYPFSQFCEIDISLLSLQTQPNTAPNLFQRGVEYGKYGLRLRLLFRLRLRLSFRLRLRLFIYFLLRFIYFLLRLRLLFRLRLWPCQPYVCMCVYIYRERDICIYTYIHLSLSIYIYMSFLQESIRD